MIAFLIFIGMVTALAYRVASPAELQQIGQKLAPLVATLSRWRSDSQSFRATLRINRPWVVVAPALCLLNVVLFARLLLFDSSLSATALLEWGASQATRTASGEWWRLLTATFVNAGFLQFIVTVVTIVQIGALLERLVGPTAVACAYLAAGALGHVVMMSDDVTGVFNGGLVAIFGLYGALLAASLWGLIGRKRIVVPLAEYKLLAPGAIVVVLCSLVTYGMRVDQNVAGITVGFIIGLAGAMKSSHMKVTFGPVVCATSVALAGIVYVFIPVQSLVTVRQQLAELAVIEEITSGNYREVLRRFTSTHRRIDAAALTTLIDGSIVPQLTRAAADLAALDNVTPAHRELVASAMDYLRLREASWRLRAEGLRKGNMRLLQQADSMEQESMHALRQLQSLRSERSEPTRTPDES